MDEIPFINLEYIFSRVVDVIRAIRNFFTGDTDGSAIGLAAILAYWKLIATILAILFIAGIIYALIRKREIDREQDKRFESYFITHVAEPPRNERWEKVERLFGSVNPSDWRLAIIEADAMLDDLVISLGYPGANLGERLKNIERSDFPTLDEAWEAHKVRNRIAHEGMQFNLTERDARQAKINYETVFRDAGYI